eukprot:3146317-Ditylum_brightwellii.AAC.1
MYQEKEAWVAMMKETVTRQSLEAQLKMHFFVLIMHLILGGIGEGLLVDIIIVIFLLLLRRHPLLFPPLLPLLRHPPPPHQ